ncbi:hypothetical protein ABS764_12785 [Flavobacterium sp. ST-87]|uniref:Lipoprotein n=1 Tax=Flavobacterium plantiphilum TaxID=3163297 RepID=A0ABW8XVM9_9FLAO
MNTIVKLFSLVFVCFFFACSNDTDESQSAKNEGSLTIGDKTVTLSQAYLESYGKKGNSYNTDFSARSETLSGNNTDAAVVYFELFSSQDKKLTKGDYMLGDYSSAAPFTYTLWGESLLGINITSTDKGLRVANGLSIKPTEGVFTVTENGKQYQVNFSGKGTASTFSNGVLTATQDNVEFTMEYTGNVKMYEGVEYTAKRVNSKERVVKTHMVLFE